MESTDQPAFLVHPNLLPAVVRLLRDKTRYLCTKVYQP